MGQISKDDTQDKVRCSRKKIVLLWAAGTTVAFVLSGLIWLIWLIWLILTTQTSVRLATSYASCRANLHGLGIALELYGMNEEKNPEVFSWDVLVREGYMAPRMLKCPFSGTKPAKTNDPADIARHCDYILISGLDEESQTLLVRAFELPINHKHQRANILCGAQNFTWVRHLSNLGELYSQLQRTNDHLASRRAGE